MWYASGKLSWNIELPSGRLNGGLKPEEGDLRIFQWARAEVSMAAGEGRGSQEWERVHLARVCRQLKLFIWQYAYSLYGPTAPPVP